MSSEYEKKLARDIETLLESNEKTTVRHEDGVPKMFDIVDVPDPNVVSGFEASVFVGDLFEKIGEGEMFLLERERVPENKRAVVISARQYKELLAASRALEAVSRSITRSVGDM